MRLEEQRKNVLIAYILWWFLGFFGAHRFYIGKEKAIIMLLITIFSFITLVISIGYIGLLVMFMWWIFDGIMLHKWVKIFNLELIDRYEKTRQNN